MPKPKLIYKNYKEVEVEVNNLPSLTVKGETYTITELFERAKNGLNPEETIQDYVDVDDINKINHLYRNGDLDLTDLAEFDSHLRNLRRSIEEQLEQKRQEIDIENVSQVHHGKDESRDSYFDKDRDDSLPSEQR